MAGVCSNLYFSPYQRILTQVPPKVIAAEMSASPGRIVCELCGWSFQLRCAGLENVGLWSRYDDASPTVSIYCVFF